jgi:2-polyprenyl-3-methyl-5-hydroxy-6-metoxy-1,4-benzoquinol methylase
VTDLKADCSDAVLRLFDAKAATWSSKYAADGRLTGRLTELVAAVELRVAPGGRVLDLGCGTGELARGLAARGYHLTGCDISAEMLDRAEAHETSRSVAWVLMPPGWQSLPFDSASFDAVMGSSVLEYVDDPLAVLSECARIVRPGGAVICTVPDVRHPVRWLELLGSRAIQVWSLGSGATRSTRFSAYVSYLQVSRQRHGHQWWRRTGELCDLQLDRDSVANARPSPLRLITFVRQDPIHAPIQAASAPTSRSVSQ